MRTGRSPQARVNSADAAIAPATAGAWRPAWILALLLAGCGTWTHPSKSTAEFHAEKTACEQRAVSIYPVVLVQRQTSPGRWVPGTRHCTTTDGKTQCVTTPGHFEPPTWTTEDANAGSRASMIDDCLRAGGWVWKWN